MSLDEEGALLAELSLIASEVFASPGVVLAPESTAADVNGWDSLSHGRLIARVEARFGIAFSMRDMMAMADVGALIRLIQKRRNEAGAPPWNSPP